jgi:hypothetical protein
MTDRRRDLGKRPARRDRHRAVAGRYQAEDRAERRVTDGIDARIDRDDAARARAQERAQERAAEEAARDRLYAKKREDRARQAKGNWRLG